MLIRARYPIIYVISWEEERVEKQLAQIAAARNKKFHVWTYTQGIVRYGAEPQRTKSGSGSTTDPLSALDAVLQHVEPAIYLFKDFHPFTEENRANLAVIRRLKDVAYHLRDTYKTIVIVAPVMRIAPELDKDVTVIEYRPPDVKDFNRLLDRIIEDVKDKPQVRINLDAAGRERLLHAARVWKSDFHCTPEAFDLLDGVVDVFVADFKFGNDACARRIAGVGDYMRILARNLRIAAGQSRLIVRHLLLPGHLACCYRPIAQWMAANLPDVPFSLREGYLPSWRSARFAELAAPLESHVGGEARDLAHGLGLKVIQ